MSHGAKISRRSGKYDRLLAGRIRGAMPAKKSPSTRRRWLLSSLLLVACLGAAAFAVYVLVLDQEIRKRFSGARWALPAQIYASPLELYPGLALEAATLEAELRRLGYRSGTPNKPGKYRRKPNELELHTRSFAFWDGPQAGQAYRITLDGGRIVNLQRSEDQRASSLLRLDPLLIGSIFPAHGEDRVLLKLEDTPAQLVQGLVEIEDQRFYQHFGLDPRAILRAALANMRSGAVVQGGSTLTQQLVKNFFLNNQRTLSRKLTEAVYALLIELHYGKGEILEAYLNEVYLGQDGGRSVHGFGLASQFYFRKPLPELEVQELALLVALVKGPSYYDPRRHPQRARERRDLVLSQWLQAGIIDAATDSRARLQNLGVTQARGTDQARFPAFVDLVRRELSHAYDKRDLTHEGLRIFTTLNPRIQALTETSVTQGLERLQRDRKLDELEGAAVVTSVVDGSVLALVGGRDPRYAGFNRALDAQRPIGSLAKPAVYLAALEQPRRFQLITPIPDTAVEIEQRDGSVWRPQNYDKTENGPVPLYRALVKSFNLATINLALDVGLDRVADVLDRLGGQRRVAQVPSLALGAFEMSPLEVADSYGTLAAAGFRTPISAIREVITRENVPLRRFPFQLGEAVDSSAVFLLDWALQQVMQQGTGRGAYRYLDSAIRVAGKTGTTDELRDSWFAGYGADLLSVVWVGRDDNAPAGLTGAAGALPIWSQIMSDAGVQSLNGSAPEGVEWMRVDLASHLPAPEGCRTIVRIPFTEGSVPDERAPCARRRGPLDFFKDLWR